MLLKEKLRFSVATYTRIHKFKTPANMLHSRICGSFYRHGSNCDTLGTLESPRFQSHLFLAS